MRVISLHHVAFEGLGSLESLIAENSHAYRKIDAWTEPTYPDTVDFDILIVMGGPMGVDQVESHPWLLAEKAFLKNAIASGKTILGICLGAQLIAEALGARVYRGHEREIGWYPVDRDPKAKDSVFGRLLPERFEAFHWHGDTFDIPEYAVPLGRSEACAHQGFVVADRVIALQFHLETTPDSAAALIDNSAKDIKGGGLYVQDGAGILEDTARFGRINGIMLSFWRELEKTSP